MSDHEVISVLGLSKAFPIYDRHADMLLEVLTRKRRHSLFWALREVSFSVRENQRLGIIGPNGSGKSTLLRILSGNLASTAGTVIIRGRVSAMLTLATALNPEDTGLSNTRFNLLLNGCNPSNLERFIEDVVEFAELGPFIHSPVKTYSAGMNARLSFAIATAIEPEILIVDEVLSAGDAYFVGKATKRMLDLCDRGKALVFVSHATNAIQMLCDTVLWLDNGSIRNIGPADYILKLYEEDYRRREDQSTREANILRRKQEYSHLRVEDADNAEIYRVRLVPRTSHTFTDTYYVRYLRLSGDGMETTNISLSLADLKQSETRACLDLLGSEWGRLYSKNGQDCRTLAAQTSRSGGGQLMLKRPPSASGSWKLSSTVEYFSLGKEELDLEFADYIAGRWRKAESVERSDLKDGWKVLTARFEIPIVEDEQYRRALEKIRTDAKPNLEIRDISVLINGEVSHSVGERKPFEIQVRIVAHRRTAVADVGIKILRSDGVFVFWQSSGINGENLLDVEGEVVVSFLFEQNYLTHGEYSISAYCANGWNLATNYPYSEVFDRKVNGFTFSVRAEFPILDFGQINMRVPVVYRRNPN